MTAYWPWWAAAAALGTLTVGFWFVVRRPLGVSGVIGRLVDVRAQLEVERKDREGAAASEADLDAALLAATTEAFGCDPGDPVATSDAPSASAAAPGPAPRSGRARGPRPPLLAHALFLGGIVAGGALSAAVARRGPRTAGLGPAFEHVFGGGPRALGVLLAGGVLVGFGTTLADGCSTGHGLTGSSRLRPGSLLATGCFMAAAVAISLALGWRAS